MTVNLDEITKLLGEITQGEWTFTLWGDCISIDSGDKRLGHVSINDGKGGSYKNHVSGAEGITNAKFIAAAPTIIRELVGRVRAQDAAIAGAVDYLTKLSTLKREYANNVPAVSEKIGRNMDESVGYWKGALDITEYYAKESLRLFEDKEST